MPSGPLSPGAESCEIGPYHVVLNTNFLFVVMDVPVVSARSPVLFDNDDSFIGSITTSRARPSLISGKYFTGCEHNHSIKNIIILYCSCKL